jgi:2-polyprenyl-6-methoxyphenol hydroxylase-like FAD-dependent oxidoreductase
MTSQTDPFRVVIVGAGVAGLTLAHSLDLAGIDYVLIDKGIVAPPWGISITLHPHACRILHQIDCFEAVSSQCTPMELFCLRRPDEKVYHEH